MGGCSAAATPCTGTRRRAGSGSNTSIQDAFNLAWKVAYVVKGHAGPGCWILLPEGRPVGEQVVARANQSRVDYGPVNARSDRGQADPVAAGLAKLKDPAPDGVQRREALIEAIEYKNTEFNAQGTELNQRYQSTAVVPNPTPARSLAAGPRAVPAGHHPSRSQDPARLARRRTGRKVSTLDVTGKGKFTLVTGLSGQAWATAASKLDLPFLRTVIIGANGTQDLYHNWHRARETDEAGAILVRPDGYVAWRHRAAVWDEEQAFHLLREAVESVLSRRPPAWVQKEFTS